MRPNVSDRLGNALVVSIGAVLGLSLWASQIPVLIFQEPGSVSLYWALPSGYTALLAAAGGGAGLWVLWRFLGFRRDGTHAFARTIPLLPFLLMGVTLSVFLPFLHRWTRGFLVLARDGWPVLLGVSVLWASMLYKRLDADGHEDGGASLWHRLERLPILVKTGGVILASWAVFVAFLPGVLRQTLPTGDEPDYLLQTHSLWTDGDLDLKNNLERRDYRRFGLDRMTPHVVQAPAGGLYTHHRPGLSMLLLPAYALKARAGPMLLMAGLAACLGGVVFLLGHRITGDLRAALFAWAAVTFSPPVAFYAYQVYPEIPAALLIGLALLGILQEQRSVWLTLGIGLCLAFLPWLHERFILVSLVLAAVYLGRHRPSARDIWLLAGFLGLSGIGLWMYFQKVYGTWFPAGAHHGYRLWTGGLFGLFWDRGHGLIPLSPVYFLAIGGAAVLCWRQRALWMRIAAVGAGYFGVIVFYQDWPGGFAPPARYLTALVPVLSVCLAAYHGFVRSHAVRWGHWFLALGGWIVAVYGIRHWHHLYRHEHPLLGAFQILNLSSYFPSLVWPTASTYPLVVFWLTVVALWLGWVLVRRSRGSESAVSWKRERWTPGLWIALFLLITWVTEGIAGQDRPARDLILYQNREGAKAFVGAVRTGGLPAVRIVASRDAVPLKQALTLFYEAQRFCRPPGRIEGGVCVRRNGTGGGAVFWGQYENLPEGPYTVHYRLRLEEGDASTRVRVDVAAHRGKTILAFRDLGVSSEGRLTSPSPVALPVGVPPGAEDLEFRVHVAGPGTLRIEGVGVVPHLPGRLFL